jgi:hypothetical protein
MAEKTSEIEGDPARGLPRRAALETRSIAMIFISLVVAGALVPTSPPLASRPQPLHVGRRGPVLCCADQPAELIACKAWVENVVMGLNLCPWAAPARTEIRYAFTDAAPTGIFEIVQQEMATLRAGGEGCPETTILVCPNAPADYDTFRELHAGFESLMTMMGMSAEFQLVAFHPEFEFGVDPHEPWQAEGEDPGHFTNRSPYPMLHLLRQASVAKAVESHKDSRSVSQANEEALRAIGADELRRLIRESS